MTRVLAFVVFIMSAVAFGTPASMTLSDYLRTSQVRAKLDAMTRTTETKNKVTLLHLGQASKEARLKLIDGASQYIFMSTMYWHMDEEGNFMREYLKNKKRSMPAIDSRYIMDWSTPYQDGAYFGKHPKELTSSLQAMTEGETAKWNPPSWGLRFSYNLIKNRTHDKIFIVDGKSLILGGINMADEYLAGGATVKGWHDDDTLIEGPAAQVAAKTFIKQWELIRWLDNDGAFPINKGPETEALQNIFYNDNGHYQFAQYDKNNVYQTFNLNLPLEKYISDSRYFPALTPSPDATALVRVIYDNQVVDKDARTGKSVSKIMNTFKFLVANAKNSVKMFAPYLTITASTSDALISAAKRGVTVSIITNSLATNDQGLKTYLAGVSHYRKLMEAGVHVYEWQGNQQIVDGSCRVKQGQWPGGTVHTKALIVDDSVVMTGSHNMNVRSELYNTETMALINDAAFGNRFGGLFNSDVDYGVLHCENSPPQRRLLSIEITPVQLQETIDKYDLTHMSFNEKYL